MAGYTCQDCVYSTSLDWANFEKSVILCTHPSMGCIGNWVQRIVQVNQRPCEHFMTLYKEAGTEPN
jgi:putative AlgH/UPF0301 family transcriptional regulator